MTTDSVDRPVGSLQRLLDALDDANERLERILEADWPVEPKGEDDG